MNLKYSEKDQYIIEQYQQDEEMMIFIFAQWCVNEGLDAIDIYEQAYPNQMKNEALHDALEKTVPKNEADEITLEVVQHVLQLIGNDDLAFMIQEVYEQKNSQST